MTLPFDRRTLLAALVAGVLMPGLARAAVTSAQFDLPLKSGRVSRVTQWQAPNAKGVVLFSHGAGAWPERYDPLAQMLVTQGFTVLAPLHTDSQHVPDDKRSDLRQAFAERLEDMATLSGYATRLNMPLVAMGHSYGSLFALMLGGALDYIGKLYNPVVKAVVCWSSPGAIPGLINPASYATVKVPLLMITGDQDEVPGMVSDWHAHLLPYEGTTIKDSYALIVKGGEHKLVVGEGYGYDVASAVTRDFLAKVMFGTVSAINLPGGAAADLMSK
jgi:pimeloyl-ACP methyl ester carboxylesterase